MPLFKKSFYWVLLFIASSLHLFGTHSLSFNDFSFDNAKETGILPSLQGQLVQVRGFWYPLSPDEGILAPHPQLKSCCLQTPAKIEQQLLIRGKTLSLLSSKRVLTLEGILHIQPAYNSKGELIQFFVLEQAQEVPKINYSISQILIFSVCVICALLWFLKRFIKLQENKPR